MSEQRMTEQERIECGQLIRKSYLDVDEADWADAADAAFAYIAPRVRAEAHKEAIEAMRQEMRTDTIRRRDGVAWEGHAAINEVCTNAVVEAVLARLTAKPDPAVEAALGFLDDCRKGGRPLPDREWAERIVETVRRADSGGGR